MRAIKIEAFEFHELSPTIRADVIRRFRENYNFPWHAEYDESLKTFTEFFGIEVDYVGYQWEVTIPDDAIRGLKLKSINRDYMPTGFVADNALWVNVFDEWATSGNIRKGIDKALTAFFKEWEFDAEMIFADDDACIDLIAEDDVMYTANGQPLIEVI